MGILSWIVLGLIAGILARWIMPGPVPMGIILTIVLGIAGALLGGFVAGLVGFGDHTELDLRSLAVAVGGALLLLVGYRLLSRNRG